MLTSESRKWPVQNARGAILATPRMAGGLAGWGSAETKPHPNPKGSGRFTGRNPWGLGSFLYLITIFLKHAFERVGKRQLDRLPRAFAVLVERLVAGLEPPVRRLVVVIEHDRP